MMGDTIRSKFRPARAVLATVKAEAPRPPAVPRRARMLALAHYIERAIERGEVGSYGEVARGLGISRPRLTQIMDLLLLSPAVQERMLFSNVSLRDLKRAVGEAEWGRQ